MFKKFIKIAIMIILGLGLLFVIFLGGITLANKKHDAVENISIENNQQSPLDHQATFSVTTFNIGYGGLDQDQNFFADGGVNSRGESKEKIQSNIGKILDFIEEESSDFYLLQEIDIKASRTYKINELDLIKGRLPQYGAAFAYNYNSIWVPAPILKPMGYVNGGMSVFSKFKLENAKRYQLQGQESWPMILFELDRCFIETSVPLDNGKNLILVNLHLSAYDEGGVLRSQQVAHLKSYINEQYSAGNYVVLGGDWNQLLSDIQINDPDFIANWPDWLVKIQSDLTDSGYKWGVDDQTMTVRDLVEAYKPGETFETIIDGFLVSPNVEIVEVKGHDLHFENSDHNPLTIKLKFEN